MNSSRIPHRILFRHKCVNAMRTVRMRRIDFGFDIPLNLVLWVCTVSKDESRYLRSGVCELKC